MRLNKYFKSMYFVQCNRYKFYIVLLLILINYLVVYIKLLLSSQGISAPIKESTVEEMASSWSALNYKIILLTLYANTFLFATSTAFRFINSGPIFARYLNSSRIKIIKRKLKLKFSNPYLMLTSNFALILLAAMLFLWILQVDRDMKLFFFICTHFIGVFALLYNRKHPTFHRLKILSYFFILLNVPIGQFIIMHEIM